MVSRLHADIALKDEAREVARSNRLSFGNKPAAKDLLTEIRYR